MDFPTVLVIDDDAAVENRLLIRGVRVRSDHAKGIANHALK
jgi:hypothetical protein